MQTFPGLDDIQAASRRIAKAVHRTPVLTCDTFDSRFQCRLFFKCENLQKTGAFKARGAVNATFSLDDTRLSRGVATHSSGNHGAALAYAAGLRGVPAYIVVPENAPPKKIAAIKSYGGAISFCEPGLRSREEGLETVIEKTGATFIHPYDNDRVIGGQATVTLELLEEPGELDIILVPVGGGGLLAGTALAAHYLSPSTRVIACEPAGADDACRSFRSGRLVPSEKPETIADGLLTSLGTRNFAIIREHVQDIVTVSDEAIIEATRQIIERMKIVVEPSAAVCLAALLENKVAVKDRRVAMILSGGNLDMDRFLKQI